jgi:diaminopimelate decarboxylase
MEQASQRMAQLYGELRSMGFTPEIIDLGGGLGVKYKDETPPDLQAYANALLKSIRDLPVKLVVEPGRVLVANAGILLTRVVATKQTAHKKFLIVDAGMNDLVRPAMYDAYHEVCAVRATAGEKETYDVVGPVCETGDLFGTDRSLVPLTTNDLVYLRTAGAYSSSMTSQYNARLRPAEVLVNGGKVTLIREREEYTDLWRREPDVVLD